jgi:CheY-like chemotaxis protein
MNQLCQHCGYDIHVDDTQVPPYAFTVDCPRCRKAVTMSPPAKPEVSLKGDGHNTRTQAMGGSAAPPAKGATGALAAPDPAQLLMQLMTAMTAGSKAPPEALKAFAWARKQVLICSADPAHRNIIETNIDNARYELTVAQTSAQAIEFLHDLKIEIILLDPQFDAARQGGIAVLRHVSSLMPKYRRRVYIVLISPQVKTLDTYMAFLNCVNLTVNTEDLESISAILEKSIKDYNDLYRPYYEAGGSAPF